MNYEDVICDANNLYRAYKASVKGSKWKEATQKFEINYLKKLFDIQEKLRNRTLMNSPVKEFSLSERGRIRPITSIRIEDRIVRHVLCDDILLPEIRKRVIYDNGASIKGRGISHQRERFEVHLRRYYKQYGNNGYILFGDFSKFYDNVIHDLSKNQLLELFNYDDYLEWLLTLIFDGFKIDVSYMSDEEYSNCITNLFNKLEYRTIPKKYLTGDKYMYKSVNIGDQLSQIIGIYYPHSMDNYIKYVKSEKFYGRYMDDWYIMSPDKDHLKSLLNDIRGITSGLGIHINEKKTHIVKISGTYKFLQVKYSLTNTGKIIKRINPKRITSMRRKLKKLAIKVNSGEILYDNVENMFRGWMGSFYKLMSKQQRQNIIKLYEELFDKDISVAEKKLLITDKL